MRRKRYVQRIPLADRAYYTREEVCQRYGFSGPRLKELIEADESLPMMRNGKVQLFPKAAMDIWFETAAMRRQGVAQ